MPKAERSMPDRPQAGLARAPSSSGRDHVAARGDDDDVDAGARRSRSVAVADHLPVEHRLVERHRDVLLGLEADRVLELVGVLDRRQAQRAHGDPLVGDAEADGLAKACGRRTAP